MAQKTNLNIAPYYSDYDPLKNFYKILFRPGYAVQARELTQLQDILQNQIESFGSGIYKEGQAVVGGEISYVNNATYVKISRITSGAAAADYVGYTISGETSGVKARVLYTEESTETDSVTFFVQFTSSGSNNTKTKFQEGETLLSDHPNKLTAVVGVSGTTSPTVISYDVFDNSGNKISSVTKQSSSQDLGAYFSVGNGIYYIRGYMVRVDADTLILSKYHTYPTCKIGFDISEIFVTPEEDESLLDNAQGSTNFSSPGAHRFKISTKLVSRDINQTDENFVEIARVINGVLRQQVKSSSYKWLWETLARRTYDESGNYVVNPFSIDLKEWINTNNQDGLFVKGTDNKYGQGSGPSESEVEFFKTSSGDAFFDETGKIVFNYGVISERLSEEEANKKFVVSIGSGKAYVNGYELETTNNNFIVADKARTTQFRNNTRTSITEGQHTFITNVFGTPDFQNISTGGTSYAFNNLKVHKTFTDGFLGLTDQNIGNECRTTYHLVTTNTTVYSVGQSLGTGVVVYFAPFTGGSTIVLTGSSDYLVGAEIGNGVITSVYKQAAEPIGVVRPKFFRPTTVITDQDKKVNKTSEFKLGLHSSVFFTHLYVRTIAGTPVVGKQIIGSKSRAKAIIEIGSNTNTLVLSNISGNFQPGENLIDETGNYSCSLKRLFEVDRFVITNFTPSPSNSITIKYVGQELTLSKDTDYTKTTNGSTYTINLTENGRNKIYNFYGNGTPGYVEVTKIDNTSGNFGYGVIVQNYQKSFSFDNAKSVYGLSSADNKFSADMSYLNVSRTASYTVTNGSNYSAVAGGRYLECQDVSQDPSGEVSPGDIISVVDDNGVIQWFFVHFTTSPVGQSTVRQNGRIYVTTSIPSNITKNQVVVYFSKTNNADRNTLLYRLPTKTTATIESVPSATDINYTVYRQFMGSLTNGNQVVFSLVAAGETFLTDASQYVLSFADSTSNLNGKIVQLNSSNLSFSDSDKKVTIVLPFTPNPSGNFKVKLVAPVSVVNGRAKRKIKRTSINPAQPNYTLHKAYISSGYNKEEVSLDVVDVFRVRSIYAATTPTGNPTDPSTRTNVSDRYYLDDGQTDNYYGISKLVLRKGFSPANGPLYVDFDYFEHTENGDFFSVDSYTGSEGVDYSEIPSFNSQVLNRVDLRDCIDFRPSVNPSTSVVPVYDGVSEFDSLKFYGAAANASRVPIEFTTFDCDIENYVPRRDSIYLTPIGDLVLVSGIPSDQPQFPSELAGSLRLFDLSIPAYTFSVKDIGVKQYNYQRYTMKDIQSIDKRVKRLEEVVSLSLLEQNTLNTQVRDAVTNLDRFKNGIIVDDFRSYLTGAVGSPEYKCSIDTSRTHLRSPFYSQQVQLEESTSDNTIRRSNGYVRSGDYIHLPYTNVEMISNRNATGFINLQPYSVFTYSGELSITPELDEWSDITTIPENRVTDESLFNTIASLAGQDGVVNTKWDDWNTTWTGVVKSETLSSQFTPYWYSYYPYYYYNYYYYNYYWWYGYYPYRWGWYGYGQQTNRVLDTVQTQETRIGTETVFNPETSTTKDTNLGERIVDISLARFMRSRVIKFRSSGMKPNTRLYAFFDGQDVNAWISPDSPVQVGNQTLFNSEPGTNQLGFGQPIITDDNGVVQGVFVIPNGNPPKPYVKSSQLTSTVNGVTTSTGVSYRSNSLQSINGVNWYNQTAGDDVSKIVYYNPTQVPINQSEIDNDPNFDSSDVPPSRQFKVGDRVFRLTSSINDSRLDRELESYSEKTYTANGLIGNKQDTILSTRIPSLTQRQTSETRTTTTQTTRTTTSGGLYNWYRPYSVCLFDPVAQSFTVEGEGKGLYVTGLDVFFKSKSEIHDVNVYLTSTDNGRPTEVRIPGTTVAKSPNTIIRVVCTLGSGINSESFVSGTQVVGTSSGTVGILKSNIVFQSTTVNPNNNVTNTVYDVMISNYIGTGFIPGETIRFTRETPVTSTFSIVNDTVSVSRVDITNFGSGYKELDEVTNSNDYVSVQFSAPQLPGGIQATGFAKVSNGRVYEVVVTNPGVGYTSTPSVTFVGGGATVLASAKVNTKLHQKSVVMGVATSDGATVPTRFDFDGPVYLESGKTYAFVVYSPSSLDYKIFVSRLGEKKLLTDGTTSNELVDKQPLLGSLFKSQNTELWTEEQLEDITFVLYKANFDTSSTATIEFYNSPLPTIQLVNDPITTNNSQGTGSFFGANPSIIRVRCLQPHGLLKGDLVTITGVGSGLSASSIGGIGFDNINKQHTVLQSDFYTFDINVGQNATSSVTGGGINGFVTSNLPYEVIQPQVGFLKFQETDVKISLTSTLGGTLDEGYTELSYTQDSPVTVYTGQDYYFRSPRLVASNDNEVLYSSPTLLNGKKSFRMKLTMSSLNPDLSPIIDTQRVNAILVRSLIDDPDMNDDRFGPTRTLITFEDDIEVTDETHLYGVSSLTSLNGSISKIISYNSSTKEALVEKIDNSSILPSTDFSGYIVKSTSNTTVNDLVDVDDTSITVLSHTLNVDDFVKINNEIMQVIGTSPTSLSVIRALYGTTATTHQINDDVYPLIRIGSVFGNDVPTVTSVEFTGSAFYVPETNSNNGSSFAKFVTKPFTLENPSDQIDLTVNALLFDLNSLKCYYRVISENETRNPFEVPWVPFNGNGLADNVDKSRIVNIDDINPLSIPKNQFFEYKYSAKNLTPFTTLELKFVMNSVNPALSPLIDDYRVICTV